MGSFSIWHWMIVLVVVLVLFGGGNKISGVMGDFAKGIKSFKKNMGEDESMEHGHSAGLNPPAPIPPQVVAPVQPAPAYQAHAAQVPYPASTQNNASGSVRNPG